MYTAIDHKKELEIFIGFNLTNMFHYILSDPRKCTTFTRYSPGVVVLETNLIMARIRVRIRVRISRDKNEIVRT